MIITSIGILGMLIILVCFIANETNKLDRHSVLYDGGNVLGSIILLIYSFLIASWPFLILNIVWGFVALRDLIKTLSKVKNSAKL
jgi:hypothetical protein